MIRVMIVDDQALVRAGFAMLVRSQLDLAVVAECVDGVDCLKTLKRLDASENGAGAVDVILMDVRMPRLDGTRPRGPSGRRDLTKVLVLTTFDLDEYAFTALRAGASGFLLKDAPPEDLLAAIRTVHAGDAVIAPSTTRRLVETYVRGAAVSGPGRPHGRPHRSASARPGPPSPRA